jgi:mono/diheme cytochrome c family protein
MDRLPSLLRLTSRFLFLASGIAFLGTQSISVGASPQPPAKTTSALSQNLLQQQAILKQYCVSCHSPQVKSGGLVLTPQDLANPGEHAAIYEKVVRKLRAGVMPPAGMPRPPKAAYDGFLSWLETELDSAAAAHPNAGRTEALHRLNRAEYQNAVRDLLTLDVNTADLLPADDASYGFDNIAGVLKVSQTLMERYLSVAGTISRLAVGEPPRTPEAITYRLNPQLPQYDHIEGLPFGTRGGALIHHVIPADAEYDIRVQLQRASGAAISGLSEPHDLEISVDGAEAKRFTVKPVPAERGTATPAAPAAKEGPAATGAAGREKVETPEKKEADADLHFQIALKAGPRDIGVAFLMKDHAEDTGLREPFKRLDNSGGNGVNLSQPHVAAVIVTGPLNIAEAKIGADTPSRQRIFVCHPATAAEESPCAEKILSSLARHAYRRPITNADTALLMSSYKDGRKEGDFEQGVEVAIRRMLVSPEFLFRVERDPANIAPTTNYRVSDLELASRLSFFLWSSIPDDELVGLAMAGKLKDREVLHGQVRRMLADSRSRALVENFAGQWLYLRNLPAATPNLDMFPDFDEGLRQDMRRETELFFGSIIHQDRSVLTLLNADYTYLNERLARHYGIPNVYGSHFRRVSLGDQAGIRGGLLGQGSILTVTSHNDRTSPVVRGKWILENILGNPPTPPPANVPPLSQDNNVNGKVLSMRERMAIHRENPVCASCHAVIEPTGFALENFDAVGVWRDVDNTPAVPWVRTEGSAAIDASGKLPDGTMFNGPAELRSALLSRPDRFVTTLAEKLMIYALGRGIEYYDMPAIRSIVRDSARNDYHFSTLVLDIVDSQPFQMRRSE